MVKFIGIDEAAGRRRLVAVGTEFHQVGSEGSDLESEVLAQVLSEGERYVRATFDATPPAAGFEFDAHCGWHTNAVVEAHTITSGRGIFEFWTEGGPVAVLTEAGDLLVNRGAEHRFRPLTDQRLRLRYSGPADGDLGAIDTGRAPEPWPAASGLALSRAPVR